MPSKGAVILLVSVMIVPVVSGPVLTFPGFWLRCEWCASRRVCGLQPHRQETFKLSGDPLFVEKVRDIVAPYLTATVPSFSLPLP